MEKILTKNFEYQIKDLDEKKGIVIIYINGFNNKDSDGDISLPGSFKKTFREVGNTIQHWLNHNREQCLGFPLKLHEDNVGAIADSQMNLQKQLCKDVFSDYILFAEHGKTLQHSIRVAPVKYEEDRTGDQYTRKVSEWKLLMEYSTLYGWGANQQTPLIDIKSIDDLELMMREGNYSDEKAKLIEETYYKLKKLLDSSDNKPQATLEIEPVALGKDESALIKHFYKQLKLS